MKSKIVDASRFPLNIMPRLAGTILTVALITLPGCATVDGWFAPEVDSQDNQRSLVTKSDGAEQEIDPNAAMNDSELMGDAIEQPNGFVMAQSAMQTSPQSEHQTNNEAHSSLNMVDNTTAVDEKAQQAAEGMTQKRGVANQGYSVANSQQRQINNRRMRASQTQVQSQSHLMQSHKRQIESSVENDYSVFRALNHQFIKNNSAQNQYQSLNQTVSHFVMDLVASLSPEHYGAALVVRPMTLKVTDVANPEGGKALITSMLATQMKDYGFNVFDGRKPKGKFSGDEVILETIVDSYGDQFVLYGTLTLLKSNTVASTHNAFISDFFFRNIKDGVEVYPDGSNF